MQLNIFDFQLSTFYFGGRSRCEITSISDYIVTTPCADYRISMLRLFLNFGVKYVLKKTEFILYTEKNEYDAGGSGLVSHAIH